MFVIDVSEFAKLGLKVDSSNILHIKEWYKKEVQKLTETISLKDIDETDTISAFHGTSTLYLGNIMKDGLLPRNKTNISNWKIHESIENVTYLTRKWHYFYGFQATTNLHEKNIQSYLCYVEFKVPKDLLIPDEDFIASKYVMYKLNRSIKKGIPFTIDWEESLKYYGTFGVIGAIPPKYIESFTVVGDIEFIKDTFIDKSNQYMKDFKKWQEGKGKGKLNLQDLYRLEAQSNRNGTWWMNQLKGKMVTGIQIDESRNMIQLLYVPIE